MKIARVESTNNSSLRHFRTNKADNSVHIAAPLPLTQLNGTAGAYYDINFGGSYEANNRRKLAQAKANFTPEAYRLWKEINATAKKFHSPEITYDHVLYTTLVDLYKFMESLNAGTKKYEEEIQYTSARTFEGLIGNFDIFKNEEIRKKVQPIIKKQIQQTAHDIRNSSARKPSLLGPKMNDKLVATLNSAYNATTQINNTKAFLDSNYLIAAFSADDTRMQNKLKNFKYEMQKAIMIDDEPEKQKRHLKFYDEKADQLWKNLDFGNDTYITYEGDNKDSINHLISSFTNLIKKPGQKYNTLTPENTKIVIFNDKAIFETVKFAQEEAKKDPDNTYIFIINFADILKANTLAEERESIMLNENELKLIENKGKKGAPTNIRMVLISNRDVYYGNTQPHSTMKPYLEHYNTLSIPMVNASDTKKILGADTGREYIKSQIKKDFTQDAIERAIDITNNQEGYYPEKALKYMKKVSSHYLDKEEITLEDLESYEKQTSDIKKSEESQDEFRVIFDTGKKLDDIVGNPMTKAEAQSIVNQILMGRKGYTRGYTTFLDNGSSYGGGRRHTAEAIAGEAGIPMITINARDFALKDIDALAQNANLSELKIKKLINTAKTQAEANKNKTAMIYIENFDNFGSNPLYGISSIYEQKAFSQLLSEMENVRKNENINLIIVGSTNYPDYLDENIMKPYKFLDKIVIYSPQDVKDRSDILNYYIDKKGLKIAAQNENEKAEIIKNISETTSYFSVVDLIYLLEKADDISRERGKDAIDKSDFTEAFLQTTTGRVSSRARAKHDDELVAKHECGHAITLEVMYEIAEKEEKPWHLPDQVNFITLDPRGSFGGAMFPKDSENDEMSFEKVFSELVCDFGGHASEKKFYNMDGSWGITQDMSMATNMAKLAVEKMGMGPNTGRISISRGPLGTSDISENLKQRIDSDIETMLKNAELASDKIVEAYGGFVDEFGKKYKDKVGTGECIISSDEFKKELEAWKHTLGRDDLAKLNNLEKEILEIIDKTKKGETVKR